MFSFLLGTPNDVPSRPSLRPGPAPRAFLALLFFLVLFVHPVGGQEPTEPGLEPAERTAVVQRAADLLEARYVLPETGRKLASALREAEAGNAFAGARDPEAFARAVSELLREVSGDGHLWVAVQPGTFPEPPVTPPTREEQDERLHRLGRGNFGLVRAEVLEGNVGLLEIRQFVDPEAAGETLAAAMRFLANVEALILDVRASQGGSPEMVRLISSYLFDPPAVHLFDIENRPLERTEAYRTIEELPAPRLSAVPVYVLTRASTFSAGEGLAYTLKHLGRATVVGERTAGGAHPGRLHRLDARFVMFVAEARVTSPVTGENWEGRGVAPHVEVPAEEAPARAHRLALEALAGTGTSAPGQKYDCDDVQESPR